MSDESEPCPCETHTPDGAPGAVSDKEYVIRFIPDRDWLTEDGNGALRLSLHAFSREDLKGARGKSVSVLRCITPREEIIRRGKDMSREPSWADDPVIAQASVADLRQIHDKCQRREVCVNADPTDDSDRLGPCPTHAGILRANPPLDPKQRLEWKLLRDKLADKFDKIYHFCSFRPPVP